MKAVHRPTALSNDVYTLMEDEGSVLVRTPNTPLFRSFAGGLGWPDLSEESHYAQYWAVILGEQEDGRIIVLQEASSASLYQAAKIIRALKDTFLVPTFYVENTPQHATLMDSLRKMEGLTHYTYITVRAGFNKAGKRKYLFPPETWPEFRDYKTICSIVGVPDRVRVDLLGGFERLRQMIAEKKLLLRVLPRTDWLFAQKPPYDEIVKHPLAKALIFAVSGLRPSLEAQLPRNREYGYGNAPRL